MFRRIYHRCITMPVCWVCRCVFRGFLDRLPRMIWAEDDHGTFLWGNALYKKHQNSGYLFKKSRPIWEKGPIHLFSTPPPDDDLFSSSENLVSLPRNAIDHFSAPIAIYNDRQQLIFCNRAYKELTHISDDFLSKKPTISEVLDYLYSSQYFIDPQQISEIKRKQTSFFSNLNHPIEDTEQASRNRTLRKVIYPRPDGGLIFFFEDLSLQLDMEREHQIVLKVQDEAVNHLQEGIVVFGGNNRIRLSNRAFGRLWSLTSAQREEGRHLSDLLEDVRPQCQIEPEVWDVFKHNTLASMADRVHKTGQIQLQHGKLLSFFYAPLPDGGYILSYLDITAKSQIEEALKLHQASQIQSQKDEKALMMQMLSDLREPLHKLTSTTEFLTHGHHTATHTATLTQGLLQAAHSVTQLVCHFVDWIQIEHHEMVLHKNTFSLSTMIKFLRDHIHDDSNQRQVSITEAPNNHVDFYGDEGRIKQIIFSLCSMMTQNPSCQDKVQIYIKSDQKGLYIDLNFFMNFFDINHYMTLDCLNASPKTHAPSMHESLHTKLLKGLISLHHGTVHFHTQKNIGIISCFFPLESSANNQA